jgi:transposase
MDLHKDYAVVAAVDREQVEVLPPCRVEMGQLAEWIACHLTEQDEITLEATTNAWPVVDLLRPQVGVVRVANPAQTKLIAQARIKNDKVDARALAHLLAARFLPEVWVPQPSVRDQRALARHRQTLQEQCTQVKNRLYAVLGRHNLRCPENSLFTAAGLAWLDEQTLPGVDDLQVRHLVSQLTFLQDQLDEADRLIAREASRDPRVPHLMQLTGIGYFAAFAILAAIGDIGRFPTPGSLSSYAGLVPGLHQSGNTSYHKPITKEGRTLLRWLLIQVAWSAVRWDDHWRNVYERIARRRGPRIAIVAVARKLLVVIWHMLTDQTPYFYLRPQTYVTKLQQWAYRIGRAHLTAANSREFVHNHLRRLDLSDLADSLTTVHRNGRLSVSSP